MKRLTVLTTWLTQGLFVISVCSGIPLLFLYHPTDAYNSVQKITYTVPYGAFVREFHYFSSEALLVVLFFHLIEQMVLKDVKIPKSSWITGSLAGICVITLLFTGFIIKGDQSGYSAGVVAISMLRNMPGLSFLTRLIESSSHYFYWKFFLWHILFLPVVATALVYHHSGRISSPLGITAISIALTVVLIAALKIPSDIPPGTALHRYIEGPWFFNGIQRMLDGGTSDTVVVMSAMFLPSALVLIYPFVRFKRVVTVAFILWFIWYVSLSLV